MVENETCREEEFYVVAREQGAENPSIPTWANRSGNPLNLKNDYPGEVERIDLEEVPGAFQLLNVVDAEECRRAIAVTEHLGYIEDAAVSLPRSVRHNHSLTWVVDELTTNVLWSRCRSHMVDRADSFFGKQPLGLNGRFRFYRYQRGDYFGPHTDGSWPGSKVVEGQLQHNAFEDRWSQLTFLLFLNDNYQGGNTRFLLRPDDFSTKNTDRKHKSVDVRTPFGGALCFPHGTHPFHCVHESTEILSGTKYIVRSDVLFEL
jgi:hypothetical protein